MSEMVQTTFDYGEADHPLSSPRDLGKEREMMEAPFDYGALDAETREFVQRKTDEIHGQLKRTAEGVIRIGLNLITVKERLPHGQFLPWLKSEFEMSENAALKFMQVAERFGSKSINFMNLSASILYALAAPSTSDAVVERVQSGEIEATLSSIKAAKEAEKSRADEERRGRREAERQLQELMAEVATLQRQLEEKPQVIEKPVENPETEAELARLKQKYAELEVRLKHKTQRVADLGAELDKRAHRDEQETYRQQVRIRFRQACDTFHQGIKGGMARMVTALDAASAFEGDDWARLGDVENTLKRTLLALSGLRESVRTGVVEGSVEGRS